MNNDYLAHHGVPNQRWGVKHGPPYPVVRGSGGQPKKTTITKSKLKDSVARRTAAARSKREEAAEKRESNRKAELREKVVSNPKQLTKYKSQFTKDEIEDILRDIEYNRRIDDVRTEEIRRGINKYNQVRDAVASTSKIIQDVGKAYDSAAGIHDLLVSMGKINGPKWKSGDSGQTGGSNKSSDSNKASESGKSSGGKRS